jgi:hypothetical protein
VRFLYTGIGFNIALLGLNLGNLAAVATTPTVAPASESRIAQISSTKSDRTIIRGNGVEFALPAGFEGGSPTSDFTKAMVAATAKKMPSMVSFVQVLDSDPTILRAIAMNANTSQDPSVVLVSRLPIPANVSLADLRDAMSTAMPTILPPEFKLVANKIANVGSRQIVQMEIDVNFQGAHIKESIGLFKEGNEIFQVTYVYASKNTQLAIPIFEQIISTFKATVTKPAQTPVI